MVPSLAVPLTTLAEVTSFVILVVFATVNLALFRIKRHAPPRALPRWVPLLGFVVITGFVLYRVVPLADG